MFDVWFIISSGVVKGNKPSSFIRASNPPVTYQDPHGSPPRSLLAQLYLTHWGRVTNICVGNLTIIGSDNGLSPGRRQAIIWTNAGILLIGPLRTNFSEILIGIHMFSSKKMHLKISSAKWRPFCLGLNVLIPPVQHGDPVITPLASKHACNSLGVLIKIIHMLSPVYYGSFVSKSKNTIENVMHTWFTLSVMPCI